MSESILALGDSHGGRGEVEKLVALYAKAVSAVVHLGDCVSDVAAAKLRYPHLPFYIVPGNCDAHSCRDMPDSADFCLGGRKIILTHGHRFGVKDSYDLISRWARENGADVCLFGHTHMPDIFYEGKCLMFSPGSLTRPRIGRPSYGVVSITRNGVAGRHVFIG